jgi:glycosyltransferase involved in cell wall biosynthesis
MNILLINKGVFPWLGGVETAVRMYANAYTDLGHEVTILVTHQELGLETTIDTLDGVKVVRCKTNLKLFNLNISYDFVKYIIRYINQYDIAHFNEPHFLGLMSFVFSRKIPYVISYHAELTSFGLIPKVIEKLLRNVYKKASRILIGNPTFAYRKGVIQDNLKRIKLVPYCDELRIEPSIVSSVDCFQNLPSKYYFSFSRYSHYKGLEVLEQSIQQVKSLNQEIAFVLAISGSIPQELKLKFENHKNVHLINKSISENEKVYLYTNCYGYIFPSINITESFGITQVEALKYGKPIINTYLPSGVPLVSLHNITGKTVFPNDSKELASAIVSLWEIGTMEYEGMTKRCRDRYVENFSYPRFLQNMKELINDIEK